MKRSQFQFSLSFLVSIAIAVSLLMAFLTNPSFLKFGVLLFVCCSILSFYFPRYREHPALVGAAAGIGIVSLLTLFSVLCVVIEAPIVQGELYDEDGPGMFFVVAIIAWFMGSVLAAWFGLLAGCVAGIVVELVDPLD